MLEALSTAAGLGFLLGLRYRIPAVVAASAIVAAATLALALFRGVPVWVAVMAPIGAIVALQGGYLVALVLTHSGLRADAWDDAEAEERDARQQHTSSDCVTSERATGGREPSAQSHANCLARG